MASKSLNPPSNFASSSALVPPIANQLLPYALNSKSIEAETRISELPFMSVLGQPFATILPVKPYFKLLAKGKPSKVALVAVKNKLIRQAFAVVQRRHR